MAAMPAPFKTVAVIGKSDAAILPEKLDQVVAVLRARDMAVLMDTRTAEASRTPPDEAIALEDLPARARAMEPYFEQAAHSMRDVPGVIDVRNLGLVAGIGGLKIAA